MLAWVMGPTRVRKFFGFGDCFRGVRHIVRAAVWAGLPLLSDAVVADGEFGQRVLGTIGLDAGSQPDEGIYLGNRFIYLTGDRLNDRRGHPLPIKGFSSSGFANVFAVAGTWKLGEGPYLTAAFGVPISGISIKADQPYTFLDREGLGDIFIEPLKLGWRLPRVDITSSYSIYAPTSQLNRQGLNQPQWSQQVSAGGTVFFDDERSLRLSALTSYNIYEKKLNIDLKRGDAVQIQGGLGGRFFKILDVGLAGYAMWQVAADTGSALPKSAQGLSEYAVGLGPEVGVLIPQLRAKLTARYEWDIEARSRLDGQVLMVSLTMLGWKPD
jgi:hypothetical protein